jgi:integrase
MAGKRRAHGEGNIRQRPDGRWEARITVGHNPNGTRRRKSVYGKTQAEVRRELNKLASKRDAGEVITTTRAAKLVDFLSAWIEAGAPTARGRKGSLNEGSLKSYVMHIRVHIVPGLGETRLEALTSPMIQRWVNALPVGSAENICRTLSMALNYAVKQKIIATNPASGLSIPNSGDDKELHKPLDSEEAKRFLKAAEGHRLWALWVLLLGLGMREGEALGVRRRDVDFKQNTVRVWQGKTQRSRRSLSMPLFVMSALREHIAIGPFGVAMIDGDKLKAARLNSGLTQYELAVVAGLGVQNPRGDLEPQPRDRDERGRYEATEQGKQRQSSAYVSMLERGRGRCSRAVLYRLAKALGVTPTDLLLGEAVISPNELIFQADPTHARKKDHPGDAGRGLLPRNVNREFHKLLKETGLDDRRMHDLRHSFATLMREQGEDLGVISEMLGHASYQITHDFYAHVRRGVQQRAAARMDALFS